MKLKCSKRLFLSKSGFTLIELLVVVLIIAVLAAVALPQYQKAVGKSRMAEVRTVVPTLLQAVRLYYLEMGNIPSDDELELSIERPESNNWDYFFDECLTINEKFGCRIEVYGKNSLSGITISFTEREYYEADGEDLAASWNCCDQSKSDCSGTRCRNLLGFTTYDEDRGTWVE